MSNSERNSKRQHLIDNLLNSRNVTQTKDLYSQWAQDYEEVNIT